MTNFDPKTVKQQINYRVPKDSFNARKSCDHCKNRVALSPSSNRCHIIGIEMDKAYSVNLRGTCDQFSPYR